MFIMMHSVRHVKRWSAAKFIIPSALTDHLLVRIVTLNSRPQNVVVIFFWFNTHHPSIA